VVFECSTYDIFRLVDHDLQQGHQDAKVILQKLRISQNQLPHHGHQQTDRPRLTLKILKTVSQVCFVFFVNRDWRLVILSNVHPNNFTGTTRTDSVFHVVNEQSDWLSKKAHSKKFFAHLGSVAPSRDLKIHGHLCKPRLRQY
jgi:hypothetical protein